MILSKDRYKSRTIVAIIVLALTLLKQHFDIDVSEGEVEAILESVTQAAMLLLATYWRVKAEKKIK